MVSGGGTRALEGVEMSSRVVHAGATEAIRNALKLGACDKHELARRTGLPARTVLPLVSKLCLYGGAVALGTRQSRTYAEAEVVEKAKPPGRYVPDWKPLRRDPFAHMALALETRR